ARVRGDRCRAGERRSGGDLPGGPADGGRLDRAVPAGRGAHPGAPAGAGGADGPAGDVGEHVEPAGWAARALAPAAAAKGARRGGRRGAAGREPGHGGGAGSGRAGAARRRGVRGLATPPPPSCPRTRASRAADRGQLTKPAITNSASTTSQASRQRHTGVMALRRRTTPPSPTYGSAPGAGGATVPSQASSLATAARPAAPRKSARGCSPAPLAARQAVTTRSKLPTSASARLISWATGHSIQRSTALAPRAAPAGSRPATAAAASRATSRYPTAPTGPSSRNHSSTPNQRRSAFRNTAVTSASASAGATPLSESATAAWRRAIGSGAATTASTSR